MTEAFCMKEKAKHEMNGAVEVQMKNGRRALQGTCASCGTKLFKILGKTGQQTGFLATSSPLRTEQLVLPETV
ncbi:MAG: hypothetical protein JRN09_05230 [Nitrososphaerota archaeon]|nr:hypothetical protein [Nitrososphaerota archaeon]